MIRFLVPTTLLATYSLAAAPASAQPPFEGVITFRMGEASEDPAVLVQTVKGRKLRLDGVRIAMDPSDPGVTVILDAEAGRMVMLSPMDTMALVMTYAEAELHFDGAGTARGGLADVEGGRTVAPANTNRTETVAGVECEVWSGPVTQFGMTYEEELCLAPGVGLELEAILSYPFVSLLGQYLNHWAGYRDFVRPDNRILRSTMIENGVRSVWLEATRIERKPVDDAAFSIPAGYAETTLEQLKAEDVDAEQDSAGTR